MTDSDDLGNVLRHEAEHAEQNADAPAQPGTIVSRPEHVTLAQLEARVAALEAERADYKAVLAAINVLRENQRMHGEPDNKCDCTY